MSYELKSTLGDTTPLRNKAIDRVIGAIRDSCGIINRGNNPEIHNPLDVAEQHAEIWAGLTNGALKVTRGGGHVAVIFTESNKRILLITL